MPLQKIVGSTGPPGSESQTPGTQRFPTPGGSQRHHFWVPCSGICCKWRRRTRLCTSKINLKWMPSGNHTQLIWLLVWNHPVWNFFPFLGISRHNVFEITDQLWGARFLSDPVDLHWCSRCSRCSLLPHWAKERQCPESSWLFFPWCQPWHRDMGVRTSSIVLCGCQLTLQSQVIPTGEYHGI